jgi:hypothetical protein
VASDHWLAPAGRTKSCQKSFADAADPPMTAIAQVPCAVTSEVLSGTVTAGALGVTDPCRDPDPDALGDPDAQPATRPAQAKARPARAHPENPEIMNGPAPGERTG